MGSKAQVISFNCVLRDSLGKVISSSSNHNVLTRTHEPERQAAGAPVSHFDFHGPLDGLIEGLRDVKTGERRRIYVSAEKAYGFYDPELVMQLPRKKLPQGETLEVGFQVVAQAKDGECKVFRVIGADAMTVTLDGNHPLAGQDLCFDIEATEAREATTAELQGGGSEAAPRRQMH